MNKIFKNILAIALTGVTVCAISACTDKPQGNNPSNSSGYYVPEKENVVDVRAPEIYCSYNYKIVEVGKEAILPAVEFSENNVTAEYTLDGQKVSPGAKFTPTKVGTSVFEIKAQDGAGNKSTPKKVFITVTDNPSDLNKI